MKLKEYLTEQTLTKIVNAMFDPKMAKKVANLLDISPDPGDAAEQLSMLSDKELKDIMRKLRIK
jgi:hypothetical protein